jgi:hypothetical protein
MKSFGFSVIGKYHIDRNIPCQDFHSIIEHANGYLAVIADGVSKSKYSEIASKIAAETFISFTQEMIKEDMNSETVVSVFEQAFKVSLKAIEDYIHQRDHFMSDYDTTLTGLFFTKSFVAIAHSGDGGVIGLRPNGLYVSLTEKITELFDDHKYVAPLSKPSLWKFYSYQETFARILMATDGVYDTIYSHLLTDKQDPINIQTIESFMNNKALNQSLSRLEMYKSKFIENFLKAKLTDDDITFVLLIDDSIAPERQPETYYQTPDWETLRAEFRKKLYPKQENPTVLHDDSKEIKEETFTEASSELSLDSSEESSKSNADETLEKIPLSEDYQIPSFQLKFASELEISTIHNSTNFLKSVVSKFKKKFKAHFSSLLRKNLVYDNQKTPIQYNPISVFQSKSLKIFTLKQDNKKVIYLYPFVDSNDQRKLKQLIEKSLQSANFHWMIWPQKLVYDEKGDCIGFISDALTEYTTLNTYLNYSMSHQQILNVISSSLVLAKNLCVVTSFVHQQDWVFKLLTPENFFFDSKTGYMYIVDVLSIELSQSCSLLINTKVSNLDYFHPNKLKGLDLRKHVETTVTMDIDLSSNLFSLSTILFQLLMRGYHPYSFIENSRFILEHPMYPIAEGLQAGVSYFFVEDVRYIPNPKAPSINTLPREIYEIFRLTFSSNSTTNSTLNSANKWYEVLENHGSFKF